MRVRVLTSLALCAPPPPTFKVAPKPMDGYIDTYQSGAFSKYNVSHRGKLACMVIGKEDPPRPLTFSSLKCYINFTRINYLSNTKNINSCHAVGLQLIYRCVP